MTLRLWVGWADDHLTPNKSRVPFDPTRAQDTTKLDELSNTLFKMIHWDLMALWNIWIQWLPQSQEDIKKRLENDPSFTILVLLIVNMKRDVAWLRWTVTQLAQRTENIGNSVRELNDRTADAKTYWF